MNGKHLLSDAVRSDSPIVNVGQLWRVSWVNFHAYPSAIDVGCDAMHLKVDELIATVRVEHGFSAFDRFEPGVWCLTSKGQLWVTQFRLTRDCVREE